MAFGWMALWAVTDRKSKELKLDFLLLSLKFSAAPLTQISKARLFAAMSAYVSRHDKISLLTNSLISPSLSHLFIYADYIFWLTSFAESASTS